MSFKLKKSTFRALFWVVALLPFLALSHCKLTDSGPKAKIFPENGATNVPVNAMVEIQYPPELGVKDAQMKYALFSIHECETEAYGYFNQTPANPQDPTAPAAPTEDGKKAAPTKNPDGTTKPEEQVKTASNDSQTKYKSDIKFFHAHGTDSTNTVFNYLLINPEDRSTPLKANTTYCVQTKKLINDQKVEIAAQESRFTTEESPALEFDSKIDVEFFGDHLSSTGKGKDGKALRDFILLNLRSIAVRPSQLKSQIKLCLVSSEKSSSSEACKDIGKPVASDIYEIESMQADSNSHTISAYSLYGVAPRQAPTKGQEFKIVVNRDISKNEEINAGTNESDKIEVDESDTPYWMSSFTNDVKDANGNAVAGENSKFFYVGSGS